MSSVCSVVHEPMDAETTLTPFLRGKIHVRQPKRGYRFNVDTVALAAFSWVRDGETVLDLGTGSGILLLLLGHFHHPGRLVGVELQENLAAMAAANLKDNGWSDRGQVLYTDLRDPRAIEPGTCDLVVSNPPYHEAGRGQTSATPERALARQSFSAELPDVASAASRTMTPDGRFCVVAPVARLGDLMAAVGATGLHPRLLRYVQDRPGAQAHLVMLQSGRTMGRGCITLPPLVLKDPDGSYAEEMRHWLAHDPPQTPRFLCDCMLGTLARYLRLSGCDAGYFRKAEDNWLMGECARAGHVLLTRDRPLLARCAKTGVEALDPGSDVPAEQFRRVREAFGQPTGSTDPRCLRCNAPTVPVPREEAMGKVPPYTYLTHRRFNACPCCGKLTWEGSHLERFRETVRKLGS